VLAPVIPLCANDHAHLHLMCCALPQLDIYPETRRITADYLKVVADQSATISQLHSAVTGLLNIVNASSSAEAEFGKAGLKTVSQAIKRVCTQASDKISELQKGCDCSCKDDNSELSTLLIVGLELLHFYVTSWHNDAAKASVKLSDVDLMREHIVQPVLAAVRLSWDNASLLGLARDILSEKCSSLAYEVQRRLTDGVLSSEVCGSTY
jgi:hypothetical protein